MRALPIEIRSRDLDDTLVILFHLEERTVLAPCVPELFNNKQSFKKRERERERSNTDTLIKKE